MRRLDKIKKGNNEGKMLVLKIFKEKTTDFKILSESVRTSKQIKSNISIIKTL